MMIERIPFRFRSELPVIIHKSALQLRAFFTAVSFSTAFVAIQSSQSVRLSLSFFPPTRCCNSPSPFTPLPSAPHQYPFTYPLASPLSPLSLPLPCALIRGQAERGSRQKLMELLGSGGGVSGGAAVKWTQNKLFLLLLLFLGYRSFFVRIFEGNEMLINMDRSAVG